MKAWRIHFGWSIVTALAIVISARIASRPPAVVGAGSSGPPAVQDRNPSAADPELPKTMAAPPGKGEPGRKSAVPFPDPSLADKIRSMLKNPEKWEELEKLVVGVADRPFSLRLLKEALLGKDLQSSYGAIHLLCQMKGRDVAEVLESYLNANGDSDLAPNVANALGQVNDPGSMPVLIDALRSKNPQVRLWSASALLGMGYAAPATDLIAEMARQYESPDGGVRKKAIDTVSQFDLDAVVPILTRALKDSNSDVRMEALIGFGNLKKPEYIPLLEPLLNDPIPEVAANARQYIEYLKNP